GDVERGRVRDQAVHQGVEDERVVRARREGDAQPIARGRHRRSVARTGPTRCSAVRASPIRQAVRSRGPTGLETALTSAKGTPARAAAVATPKPSIASATAAGWRARSQSARAAVPVTVDTVRMGPRT